MQLFENTQLYACRASDGLPSAGTIEIGVDLGIATRCSISPPDVLLGRSARAGPHGQYPCHLLGVHLTLDRRSASASTSCPVSSTGFPFSPLTQFAGFNFGIGAAVTIVSRRSGCAQGIYRSISFADVTFRRSMLRCRALCEGTLSPGVTIRNIESSHHRRAGFLFPGRLHGHATKLTSSLRSIRESPLMSL